MRIHTIIEIGEGLEQVAEAATNRANVWIGEHGDHLVTAIIPQTFVVQDTHYVHVITISYKLPTAANLGAMIAAMV